MASGEAYLSHVSCFFEGYGIVGSEPCRINSGILLGSLSFGERSGRVPPEFVGESDETQDNVSSPADFQAVSSV